MNDIIINNEIQTKYGTIHGISSIEKYKNGSIKECRLNEHNEIKFEHDIFIPQYHNSDFRNKYTKSLSFYEDGTIKSIALENQSGFKTSLGIIPAELVTFYQNGSIKKIFPLNGKLSGFWTEENEYNLAKEFSFEFKFGNFTSKFISLDFYDSGEPKCFTVWPKDNIKAKTPIGELEVRTGLSLYKDGTVESIEPRKPTLIESPIGDLIAYDMNVVGINGSNNSLKFHENGEIKSLLTSYNMVQVKNKSNDIFTFEPKLKPNLFNNNIMDILPLLIEFDCTKVIFNGNSANEFDIEYASFTIKKFSIPH
jgi:hypothetical protein